MVWHEIVGAEAIAGANQDPLSNGGRSPLFLFCSISALDLRVKRPRSPNYQGVN
jgi:hypothetical protein